MSAPRQIDCHCGHNKMSHEVEARPACVHEGCACPIYRPRTGPPFQPIGGGVGQLIEAGKRSDVRGIVALAERIEKNLADLRERLAADREAAAARAEVRRLEEQLAAAKAALRGGRPPSASPPSVAAHACSHEGCVRTFESGQALAMHRRRAHEGFDPNAKGPSERAS